MKKIILYFISGIAVAVTYIFVSFFFQSPPTRAEFDILKIEVQADRHYIKESMCEIKEDIKTIKERVYDILSKECEK